MALDLYQSDIVVFENGKRYAIDLPAIMEATPADFADYFTHRVSIEGDRIVNGISTGMQSVYTNVPATMLMPQGLRLGGHPFSAPRADVTDTPMVYHQVFLDGGGLVHELILVEPKK